MYNMRLSQQYLVLFDDKMKTIFQLSLVNGGINIAKRIKMDERSIDFWHMVQRDIKYLEKTYITSRKKIIAKQMLKGEYVEPSEWPHTNHPDYKWHEAQPVNTPINPQVYPIIPGQPEPDVTCPSITTTDDTTWTTDTTGGSSWTTTTSGTAPIMMTTGSGTSPNNAASITTATHQPDGWASASTTIDNFTFEDTIYISKKNHVFECESAKKGYLNIHIENLKIDTDLGDPVKTFYDTLLKVFYFDKIFKYYPGMRSL